MSSTQYILFKPRIALKIIKVPIVFTLQKLHIKMAKAVTKTVCKKYGFFIDEFKKAVAKTVVKNLGLLNYSYFLTFVVTNFNMHCFSFNLETYY